MKQTSEEPHQPARRVLFTGHAPVHFLCFRPLFERLRRETDVQVFVSGGFRQEGASGYEYATNSMYQQLGVPAANVLQVPEILEQDFDVLFAANTNSLKPRHAALNVQIFHGISFRNRAIRAANMVADRFFMAGPYMKRKFVEAGLLEASDPRALEIGFMKTDALLNGALDRSRLIGEFGFDGSRPIVAFCPTGQKRNALDVYGLELIERIKAAGQHDLLIKLHDHPHGSVDWTPAIAALQDEHVRLVQSYDVIPALFVADALITDASSVSNEYALLDRPILFMDTPELIERAREREKSMTDVVTWGRSLGTVVDSADKLPAALEQALARPNEHAAIRQRAARDLFFNPGQATNAAMNWFRGTAAAIPPSTPSTLASHVHR